MKSIVYLSHMGDRPCTAVAVTHPPELPAYEQYKHHDPRYLGRYYLMKYVCTIHADLGIHGKINRRAEDIGRSASVRIFHGHACPPDWDDKRRVGRDYQWYHTAERIAKSRYRKAKREDRTGRKARYGARGYCTIDISFGLIANGDAFNFTDTERRHIAARLDLAATSRAPLPPWHLSDCWQQKKAA